MAHKIPVKITPEEREELSELLDGHGWPALLRVIESLVKEQATRLLNTPATDSQQLVVESARYDGAKTLAFKISQIKEQYK